MKKLDLKKMKNIKPSFTVNYRDIAMEFLKYLIDEGLLKDCILEIGEEGSVTIRPNKLYKIETIQYAWHKFWDSGIIKAYA